MGLVLVLLLLLLIFFFFLGVWFYLPHAFSFIVIRIVVKFTLLDESEIESTGKMEIFNKP